MSADVTQLSNSVNGHSTTKSDGSAAPQPSRRMVRADLGGLHEHATSDGQRVQIWSRDGKYMVRGRWNGQQIGVTLDQNPVKANQQLQRILIELEDGTFVPSSERRNRSISRRPIPKADLRSLASDFIAAKRMLRGSATAKAYCDRLSHVLAFAELPTNKRKWPLARDINSEFALALRVFLIGRRLTRNGRCGAQPKSMSLSMVQHCLETLRALLHWAARAEVHKLPPEFANPITDELLGPQRLKDPLRTCSISADHRLKMITEMDLWQLKTLSLLLVLPTRFEDISGALVSDFNLTNRIWRIGSRCDGNDFNKSRVEVQMPVPREIIGLLKHTIGGRQDGPMFLARRAEMKSFRPLRAFRTQQEFESICREELARSKAADVQTEQDRKEVIRRLIRDCGGVSTDLISKSLKTLMKSAGVADGVPPYQVRHSVTTALKRAGVNQLELRYLTIHSTADILNDYTSLDPHTEMQKYFSTIGPLLSEIVRRASDLGIPMESNV